MPSVAYVSATSAHSRSGPSDELTHVRTPAAFVAAGVLVGGGAVDDAGVDVAAGLPAVLPAHAARSNAAAQTSIGLPMTLALIVWEFGTTARMSPVRPTGR